MNTIVKKIIKTFTLIFLGIYLPYMVYFIMIFLLGIEPLVNLPNYVGEIGYIVPFIISFALFLTLILYIASLLDKRVLNKWFVLIVAFSFSIIGITSQFIDYISYIKSHGN